jgi:hypothetical protein
MNSKNIFALSVAANLVLGGFIALHHRASVPAVQPLTKKSTVQRRHLLVAKKTESSSAEMPATNTFRWSDIETKDYFAFVANLRSIGCPEKTIQDILIADIEKLYSEREKSYPAPRFWMTAAERETAAKVEKEQRREWANEKKQLIFALLGVDWDSEVRRDWVKEPEAAIILGYLPEEKAMSLMKIFGGMEKEQSEIREGTFGIMLDEDKEKLRQLSQNFDRKMKNLLSPFEYEEFTLRLGSMFSGNNLVGVDLNGTEYRKIIELRTPPNVMAKMAGDDEDSALDSFEKFAKDAEPKIEELLGEQRFADYKRAQDADFQQIFNATKDFNLPVDSIAKVYDLQKAAAEEASRLRSDQTLSDEQRKAALAEAASQARQAVVMVFGSENGERYLKSNPSWLKKIGESDANKRKADR